MSERRGKPFSLARRLSWLLLISLVLLSVLLSGGLYAHTRRALRREFDRNLEAQARAMASMVQNIGQGKVEFDFVDQFMPEFARGKSGRNNEYFEIWLEDGKVLGKSPSLGQGALPRFGHAVAHPEFRSIKVGGRDARAVGIIFRPELDLDELGQGAPAPTAAASATTAVATLVLARDTHPLTHTLASFEFLLLCSALLFPLGAAGIVLCVVRFGLRPVRQLADRVGGMSPAALGQPLELESLPVELKPVGVGLNRLLARVHQSFERERQFTSNVSHELRTPLAEAMSSLSMALQWPEDSDLLFRSSSAALSSMRHMHGLIETLLRIRRAESQATRQDHPQTDLVAIITQVAEEMAGELERRRLDLQFAFEGGPPCSVAAEAEVLYVVVRNLLGNAVAYAPEGTTISVAVGAGQGGCFLEIRNLAPQLEACDLECLFEPFWRKSAERSDAREHSGLGLALVKSLASYLEWQISARLDEQHELVVALKAGDSSHREETPVLVSGR